MFDDPQLNFQDLFSKLEQSKFDFLKYGLQVRELVKNYLFETIPDRKILVNKTFDFTGLNPEVNYFKINDECFVLLTEEDCKQIFKIISESYKPYTINIGTPNNQVLEKNVYSIYSSELFIKIQDFFDKLQILDSSNNKYLELLKYLRFPKKAMSKACYFTIKQNILSQLLRDFEDSSSVLEYTKFSITLGKFIIKIYVMLFSPFSTLFNKSELTKQDHRTLTNILITFLTKNEIQNNQIYNERNISNNRLIEVINKFLTQYIINAYRINKYPYNTIYGIIENDLKLFGEASIDHDLNVVYANIGNLIIEHLEKHQIFESKIKIFNNKTTRVLKITASNLFKFDLKASAFVPYLSKSMFNYKDQINHVEDNVYNIILEDHEPFIHGTSIENETQIKNTTVLSDDNLKLNHKLCIDTEYLIEFLELFNKVTRDKATRQEIYDFLEIYQINFEKLEKEQPSLAKKLIDFALDLDNNTSQSIRALVDDNAYYLKIYSKILSFKLLLRLLLVDSIIFGSFRFFYNKLFIDYRARSYPLGYPLIIQGSKFILNFVKLYLNYTESYLKYFYTNVQNAILTTMLDKNIIKNIQNLTYDKFNKLQHEHIQNYIFHFFDSNLISYNELEKRIFPIKDLQYQYHSILPYIKKKHQGFLVLSILREYYKYGISTKALMPLDASSSGLQMISLILRSKSLASGCGLTEDASDIYAEISNSLADNLDKVSKLYLDFIKDNVENNTLNNFFEYGTLRYLEPLIDYFKNIQIPENILQYSWILSGDDLDRYKYLDRSPLAYYLFVVRVGYSFNKILTLNSWLKLVDFRNRKLPKTQAMAAAYGMTAFRRKDNFLNYFKDLADLKGYILDNKQFNSLVSLAGLCDQHFSHYLETKLPTLGSMLNIGKLLASSAQNSLTNSLTIENSNIYMKLSPRIPQRKRIIIYSRYKLKPFTISVNSPTDELDCKRLSTMAVTALIHSSDALIACEFYHRISLINDNLKNKAINVQINGAVNHDSFCLSLYPFIYQIVKDIYLWFYDTHYLCSIERNLTPKQVDEIKQDILKTGYLNREDINGPILKI
jgi:hypothetical protein